MSDDEYQHAAIKAAKELFGEIEGWLQSDLIVAFSTLVAGRAIQLRDEREAEDDLR